MNFEIEKGLENFEKVWAGLVLLYSIQGIFLGAKWVSKKKVLNGWEKWQVIYSIGVLLGLGFVWGISGATEITSYLLKVGGIGLVSLLLYCTTDSGLGKSWGWVVLIMLCLIPTIFLIEVTSQHAKIRGNIALAQSDLRVLETSIETYYLNNQKYPDHLSELKNPKEFTLLDPFSSKRKSNQTPYQYVKKGEEGWMIYSLGPDRKDNSGLAVYEPTNGIRSAGDIIRVGP